MQKLHLIVLLFILVCVTQTKELRRYTREMALRLLVMLDSYVHPKKKVIDRVDDVLRRNLSMIVCDQVTGGDELLRRDVGAKKEVDVGAKEQMVDQQESSNFSYLRSYNIYREMVRRRIVEKYVPQDFQWLIGINQTDQSLFINDNRFRDETKALYLRALTAPRLHVFTTKLFEYIGANLNIFMEQIDYCTVDLLHLLHFGERLQGSNDPLVSAIRRVALPMIGDTSMMDVLTILFQDYPHIRGHLDMQMERELPEWCIVSEWKKHLHMHIIQGELMHNLVASFHPIRNVLQETIYQCTASDVGDYGVPNRMFVDSLRRSLRSLRDPRVDIHNHTELGWFASEIMRFSTIDFGFNRTNTESVVRTQPYQCKYMQRFKRCEHKDRYHAQHRLPAGFIFHFCHFKAGMSEAHWSNPTHFNPTRHASTNTYSITSTTSHAIIQNEEGSFLPEGVQIPQREGLCYFGVGERRCPGEGLTICIIKTLSYYMLVTNMDPHKATVMAAAQRITAPTHATDRRYNGVLAPGFYRPTSTHP